MHVGQVAVACAFFFELAVLDKTHRSKKRASQTGVAVSWGQGQGQPIAGIAG